MTRVEHFTRCLDFSIIFNMKDTLQSALEHGSFADNHG